MSHREPQPATAARRLRLAEPTVAAGDDLRDRTRVLIERAATGDAAAWTRLYQDAFDDLLRHVAYMTGSVDLAEDVAQESFARALANLSMFDGRSSFQTWIRAIANNLVRKHWRKQSRRSRAHARLAALDPEQAGLDQRVQSDRRADALLICLEALPPQLREAFVLFELEGSSAQEAGAQLGISAGTFRVRVSRARTRIRDQLGKAGLLAGQEDST